MKQEKTDWSEFIEQRLAAQQKAEILAEQVATAQMRQVTAESKEKRFHAFTCRIEATHLVA